MSNEDKEESPEQPESTSEDADSAFVAGVIARHEAAVPDKDGKLPPGT